jgi:DinB family protein
VTETAGRGLEAAMGAVAALDEEDLARPWAWRDATINVREGLYRLLEDAQAASVRAAAEPHPESRRILALAQRAFGELRGLLTGLPAALLDGAPAEGQWPVRETLRHILAVERRYAIQTLYAVERADGDPVRIAEGRLPTAAQLDPTGDVDDVLDRIGQARAETNARLGDLPAPALVRPSRWMHYEIDVRFRLHRFAPHIAEHAIQCEKTLQALGWRPTEGRRMLIRLGGALAEVEGLDAAAARDLEARLVERVASFATRVSRAGA